VANTISTINPSGSVSSHAGLQFSSDGRFLTYAGKTNSASGAPNVFLYDLQTGNNLLVSQNFNATGAANTNSDSPVISPNGRFIAYRSFATNIIPDDFNNVADLFIYDASNNATILVSVNGAGIQPRTTARLNRSSAVTARPSFSKAGLPIYPPPIATATAIFLRSTSPPCP